MAGRLLRVRESFSGTDEDGVPFVVNEGRTIREGHPYLRGRESYAEPLERADYDFDEPAVEQATAAPGEKRRTRKR